MPPGWLFPLLFSISSAHIRLSFPPSFSFSDALLNEDSSLCGGSPPEGSSSTYLLAGSTIDIEWTTSVPHSGGLRMDLIDSSNKIVAVFKDLSSAHNISQSWHRLTLPSSLSCSDCILRLSQSANEISTDRLYLSCALVNIGKNIPDGDTCNRRGKRVNGLCLCNEQYEGSHCQHSFECDDDSDCGRGGSCHSLSPSNRVCYCPPGRKGSRCHTVYSSEVSSFDDSLYQLKEAGPNKMYWRIIKDEIEVVLVSPGRHWTAIGWKHLTDNGRCAATLSRISSLPPSSPSPSPSPSPSSSPSPSPSTSPSTRRPLPSSTSSPSGVCGVNEEWSECPEESRECEASCDWTLDASSVPVCSTDGCGPSRCVCKEGFVRTTANSTKCIPFDSCIPTDHSCGLNETWAQCGTACEPSCSNMYDTAPCPASCEKAACTCADNYVRHNGQCVYWGDCPDLDEHFAFSTDDNQIGDISNRSTTESATTAPLSVHVPPTSCPVNETLNECGKACETDCTSIFIREQCSSCGQTDCSCIQGYARSNGRCVYWGDCPSEDINLQKGQKGEKGEKGEKGRDKTRGVSQVIGSTCKGQFAVPHGCTTDCKYRVMWNYMEETDEVEFDIETKIGDNSWSGIGLGQTHTMKDTDMYIVKSANGTVTIHDMWSDGRQTPIEDSSRDIAVPNPMGSHIDGVLRGRFKRRRVSRDKKTDIDIGDDQCVYLLFPVEGGKVQRDGSISIHSSTPLSSHSKVCFRSCATKPQPHVNESNSCQREFRHPVGCVDSACEYTAKWNYNSTVSTVRFEISARDLGRWTGIGLSKNGEMSNADIYTGWVYEGKAYVTDRFAYGRQLPAIDPSDRSDITDIGGRIEDDIQTIWFTRPVVTKDSLTDLPLDKCYFYLFPVGGGRVLARKSSDFHNPRTPIGYHDIESPHVSSTKICLCDETDTPIPTQPPAVRRRRQTRETPFVANPFQEVSSVSTHPMACVDMVMGQADEKGGRVVDMFSVGRSSPLEDESLGGKDSLLAASAVYRDGMTTVTFRKKLQATEATDISITRGPMQVLWAQGVDPSSYRHISGGAPIKADPSFFAPQSFKYHGMDNRGVITVDFFGTGDHEEASGVASHCTGSMSFPHGCNGDNCVYSVAWESDGVTASFSLNAQLKTLEWTALGFSLDGSMINSDVVVVSVLEGGKVSVIDQFMPSYGRPSIDKDQDIFDISSSYSNGRVVANFSRDLMGVDGHDVSLNECTHFLYTPTPSSMDKNGEMKKHSVIPTPSAGKICLHSCSTLPPTPSPTTTITTAEKPVKEIKETSSIVASSPTTSSSSPTSTPSTSSSTTTSVPSSTTSVGSTTTGLSMPPLQTGPHRPLPKARYGLKIRIVNREYVPDLANEKSEYYQSFTKDLKSAVDKALSIKWKDVEMGRVISYTKGSVVATVEVNALHSSPRPVEIRSVIEETAVRGAINGVAIEPTTVQVEHMKVDSSSDKEKEDVLLSAPVLSVIWLALSILVLLLVSFCCVCLFCRCRRVSHQFSPMGSQNGKTYSDIPYKADPYPAYPLPTAYNYNTLNLNKTSTSTAGFDNKAFQHQRHFSQATTASTKNSPPPGTEGTPRGMGETNYQEWLREVASKPASQEHEESMTVPRPPSATPFVQYPNDPSAYYTLGGEHRTGTTTRRN